jgi:S1-C subfamily serine protease
LVSRLLNSKVSLLTALCAVVSLVLIVFLVRDGGDRVGAPGAVAAAPPAAGDSNARAVYRSTHDGVVSIVATGNQDQSGNTSPFPGQGGQQTALGSGIVLDTKGNILTNEHVIDGAGKVSVSFGVDKSVTRTAKVVGKDATSDLALLKIDPSGLSLHPLSLGDSSTVAVGDTTYALGNPYGYTDSFSEGIVSGLDRHMTGPNGFSIDHVIQTDAAMNPGNSGGPLLDSGGRVIGVNSQIAAQGGSAADGIGFAVPINTAKKIVPQLQSKGRVEHAYLGVATVSVTASLKGSSTGATSGALIEIVQPGSPAAKAGLRAGTRRAIVDGSAVVLGGDVVQALNGHAVKTSDDLVSMIQSLNSGSKATFQLLRDGNRMTRTVTLGSQPARAPGG